MNMTELLRENEIVWESVCAHLDDHGYALISGALAKKTCEEIAGYYADEERFRSRIEMSRYAFGRGEYKYFNYPLPAIVQQLRSSIYPHLAVPANRWGERLGRKAAVYPQTLPKFLECCHRAGQKRPTPLLLKYG
ncbi:MAG TPA: 2OG-Fe(II) oxygenase, partial [Candidatus Binatia bacterium]|nr:2OG-Fe(II) oxygenase [Candidatus Binatia bacterium]